MKKNSTVAVGRKQIFKQAKLTIGLDLGDRTSYYCILDEAGNVIWERNVPTTSNGIAPGVPQDSALSDRTGNGNALAVGEPAVGTDGSRSDRGACAQRAADRREQSKRRSTRCPDAGAAGKDRSRVVGSGAASQCAGANPSDGDSRPSGTGQHAHGAGECGARVDEIVWRAAEEVRHGANESRQLRGAEPGVARCLGSAAGRDRIVERAHRGIRSADRTDRQGSASRSGPAETSERCGDTDRVDLRV